ncbi:MAG: NAD(P)-dependent oxidoreductase, partial [Alphaproteobacteria bacterium]
MADLKGRTLLITGASRGIGLAIALRAARDGANIAVVAKTDQPHPRLPGTIHTAAEEIRRAGGRAIAIRADIRQDAEVEAAVARTAEAFGGIDIVVNNASAISLTDTPATDMKRYDLMQDINVRGTFLVSKLCLPYLEKSGNPHILAMCPPLTFRPEWFAPHVAYSMSKFGMSMCVYGLAAELRPRAIAVNGLWPRTTIATAAIANVVGGEAMMRASRKPEIVADAAHVILTKPSGEFTGRFCIDDTLLYEHGVRDFSVYRVDPACEL